MVVLERLLFRALDFTVSSIKDITREGGIAAVATVGADAETVRVERTATIARAAYPDG